jgi:hypothetical protein
MPTFDFNLPEEQSDGSEKPLIIVESDDEQRANVVGKEGEASLSFEYPFDDMDVEEPLPPHEGEDEALGDGNGTANGECVNECDADCVRRRICFVVWTCYGAHLTHESSQTLHSVYSE